jgi:hypothetical protein
MITYLELCDTLALLRRLVETERKDVTCNGAFGRWPVFDDG